MSWIRLSVSERSWKPSRLSLVMCSSPNSGRNWPTRSLNCDQRREIEIAVGEGGRRLGAAVVVGVLAFELEREVLEQVQRGDETGMTHAEGVGALLVGAVVSIVALDAAVELELPQAAVVLEQEAVAQAAGFANCGLDRGRCDLFLRLLGSHLLELLLHVLQRLRQHRHLLFELDDALLRSRRRIRPLRPACREAGRNGYGQSFFIAVHLNALPVQSRLQQASPSPRRRARGRPRG